MKIAIIGASGKEGSLLLEEASRRGHEVTAIVRDKNKLTKPASTVLEKDLFDLHYEDLDGNDVVIDAFGTWSPETLDLHQTSLHYLSDLLSNKENRLLVVGSAGSLYVDKEHTLRLVDSSQMIEMYKPLSTAMTKAYLKLREHDDVNWTYLSPPPAFVADGVRTGTYVLGSDELLVNKNNESTISYADYAIAMIDEAENGNFIKKHFTVISE